MSMTFTKRDACLWAKHGLYDPKGLAMTVQFEGRTGDVAFIPMNGAAGLKPVAGREFWNSIPYGKVFEILNATTEVRAESAPESGVGAALLALLKK
jgi:hypothetical protein